MRDDSTAWGYVTVFTGQEAALANVGELETDNPAAILRASPVLEQIRRAYANARQWFASAPDDGEAQPTG